MERNKSQIGFRLIKNSNKRLNKPSKLKKAPRALKTLLIYTIKALIVAK